MIEIFTNIVKFGFESLKSVKKLWVKLLIANLIFWFINFFFVRFSNNSKIIKIYQKSQEITKSLIQYFIIRFLMSLVVQTSRHDCNFSLSFFYVYPTAKSKRAFNYRTINVGKITTRQFILEALKCLKARHTRICNSFPSLYFCKKITFFSSRLSILKFYQHFKVRFAKLFFFYSVSSIKKFYYDLNS